MNSELYNMFMAALDKDLNKLSGILAEYMIDAFDGDCTLLFDKFQECGLCLTCKNRPCKCES